MFLGLPPQEREERTRLNRVMGVGGSLNAFFIANPPIFPEKDFNESRDTRYRINDAGDIEELPGFNYSISVKQQRGKVGSQKMKEAKSKVKDFDEKQKDYPFEKVSEAINAAAGKTKKSVADLEAKYANELSKERQYNALSEQIAALTGRRTGQLGGDTQYAGGTPYFDEATGQYVNPQLSAERNFGASDISNRLNFQVSDQQILDDYNNTRLNRLNRIVSDGNSQIAGIQARLDAANQLYEALPSGDPRRTSAKVAIDQLKSDLTSVQGAVTKAGQQITDFNPITISDNEGLRQITAFREFIKLPEERASDQLRQIDPNAYRTAVGLGQQYRRMATEPLGATTTAQTEQLRNTIEQEALNQLRLGSTLGAEERRGYEQAVRAAQTARGNIFGLGPAVQEAAQLGAAGEQRKLARYGAAQQFLASGETTGAARARDLALREGLTQQRLGAAAGFIAGGPSLANLAQQRLGQQNLAAQQYIQANQALPGQFQTAGMPQQFYQTTSPEIPVQLAGNAANIYGSMSDYQARTYGAQVQAIASQRSGASQFADIAGGIGGLFGKIVPGGLFCWVAREVYGEDNPKWLQFREWMLTKASDNLRNFYIKYGERIAESIRNKPNIKAIIRKWMDSKINGAI